MELRVRSLGHRFDERVNLETRALYRPLVQLPAAGNEHVDVAYGPHARQRLDLYESHGNSKGTVVFVHGGGFVGGDKNSDGTFYVNVGRWLARSGWTAVLPNYRLAPAATWPSGARDIEAVVQWLRSRSGTFAGIGGPLVVWGQSAGAAHVASWALDSAARGTPECQASAVMLMRGFYLVEAPLKPGAMAYFGSDETQYRLRSPVTHAAELRMPVWLSLAGYDPAEIAQHSYALAQALTLARGSSPDLHLFRHHNHVSTVQSLGSAQSDVAEEILRFLNSIVNEHTMTKEV